MSWVALLLAIAVLTVVTRKIVKRRKLISEEAYLAALENGEIVAPKVTLTGISLVTRTKGVIRLFQMTESGLKELKQVNHCFECEGMYLMGSYKFI